MKDELGVRLAANVSGEKVRNLLEDACLDRLGSLHVARVRKDPAPKAIRLGILERCLGARLAHVADALTTPVAAGEYHYGIVPFRHLLEARSVDIVGVSSAPAESERRYGVPMVPRLGFAGLDRAASQARWEELTDAAAGRGSLRPGDPAAQVLDLLGAVSGVLNAGGGNLASRWPVHIYERSALVAMARARGLPPDPAAREGPSG